MCLVFFLQGLSCLKNLQHLSLSHNHLARVNEIENCMLLQTLNLQANNLQEVGWYQFIFTVCAVNVLNFLFGPWNLLQLMRLALFCGFHPFQPPHVVNSVLLRELKLDDNSISSLEPLSRAWLPLLQILSVSQNRWELQFINVVTPLICNANTRLYSLKNYIHIGVLEWGALVFLSGSSNKFFPCTRLDTYHDKSECGAESQCES